jgi:hypothetical protein
MCLAVAPPRHFVTREPPGYRTPPDGPLRYPHVDPAGLPDTAPLDEGPPADSLWPVTNAGVMVWRQPLRTPSNPCRDGFGLSLPLEWCSRSVQLAAI